MDEAIASLRTLIGVLVLLTAVWLLSYPSVNGYMIRYEALRDFFAYRLAIGAVEAHHKSASAILHKGKADLRVPWPPDPSVQSVRAELTTFPTPADAKTPLRGYEVPDMAGFRSSDYFVVRVEKDYYAYHESLLGDIIFVDRGSNARVQVEFSRPMLWRDINGFFAGNPHAIRLDSETFQSVAREVIQQRNAPVTVLGIPIDAGLFFYSGGIFLAVVAVLVIGPWIRIRDLFREAKTAGEQIHYTHPWVLATRTRDRSGGAALEVLLLVTSLAIALAPLVILFLLFTADVQPIDDIEQYAEKTSLLACPAVSLLLIYVFFDLWRLRRNTVD